MLETDRNKECTKKIDKYTIIKIDELMTTVDKNSNEITEITYSAKPKPPKPKTIR